MKCVSIPNCRTNLAPRLLRHASRRECAGRFAEHTASSPTRAPEGRKMRRAGSFVALGILMCATGAHAYRPEGPVKGPFLLGRRADRRRHVDVATELGGERIRLIGIDTPETKDPNRPVDPFGPEALRPSPHVYWLVVPSGLRRTPNSAIAMVAFLRTSTYEDPNGTWRAGMTSTSRKRT